MNVSPVQFLPGSVYIKHTVDAGFFFVSAVFPCLKLADNTARVSYSSCSFGVKSFLLPMMAGKPRVVIYEGVFFVAENLRVRTKVRYWHRLCKNYFQTII
jgi:hypothetical protein